MTEFPARDILDHLLEKKFEPGPDSTVAKTYGKAVRELLTTPGALDQANRHHTFSRLKLMAGKYGEALKIFKRTSNPAKLLYLDAEKIMRVARGLSRWCDYFSDKKTSLTADKLQGFLNFLAMEASGAKIERLTLFSWNEFYKPDGEIRIARELERIRQLMLKKASRVHALYDPYTVKEIACLEAEAENISKKAELEKNDNETKELKRFLNLPGDLEIKTSACNEISSRLKARNIVAGRGLNKPPEDGVLRIALRDCTIEARLTEGNLIVSGIPSNPEHLLTHALNAHLFNEKAAEQAKEWWDFSMKTLGSEGAMRFYEHVGYLMVTGDPLPTERTILVIVGDPGSGKGTHLAAVEELLTFDQLTLFAKASPHKLADPKEHFSKQNLQNKLAILSGDLKHTKIRDFSDINDLFGGEPQEMEQKFKDPTNEKPIFKAIWASTPPLFKLDQAGGAWRRMQLIFTSGVLEKDRDNGMKPRMLGMLDGFFLNALIGLSYLSTNGWKFTDEQSDAEIEELWQFHSDSVQVWAANLNPEPEQIESEAEMKSSTLDGDKSEKMMIENLAARQAIDSLYEKYSEWARKKQIEPVKPKSFSAWLGGHDFTIKRKLMEDGDFKGKRKYVTYVSWSDEKGSDEDPKKNRAQDQITWEAYFSRAPLMLEVVPDSHGQNICNAREKKIDHDKTHDVTRIEMPSWIGHRLKRFPEPSNMGSGDNMTPCPILFDDRVSDKNDPMRDAKEMTEDPWSHPPEPIPDPSAITLQDAQTALRVIVADGFHAIPAESRISMDGKSFMISVSKPQSSERERILKDRLAALGFVPRNTGALGPLIFSAAIQEVQP